MGDTLSARAYASPSRETEVALDVWQEIGAGIYRRRYPWLDQNIGAILTDDGIVLVDSRSGPDDADELRDDLRRLSPLPVRWLVNTHFHWDHCFGNGRFPEAKIVGHRACRTALLRDGSRIARELSRSDRIPRERRPAFADIEIVPPEVVFDDGILLHVGGREIGLTHPGVGHTDSDVVLLVDGVTFAGDLVEEGAPPAFEDAFPRAWVATLDRLAPLLSGPVVPGHGDVVDRAFVEGLRDEIASAVAAADEGDAGPYPGEVMATVLRRLRLESGSPEPD